MKDPIDRQAAIKLTADYLYNLMSPRCIGLTPDHCWKEAEDILAKVPSAQPEQRWIPCKEQMPEPDSWAIWCSRKGLIQVARWKEDAIDHFWPNQGFFELEDAVAWMSMPERYRGAE